MFVKVHNKYYNEFKEQLFINTMPHTFFRQDYMLNKYGIYHINDIMPYCRVNGSFITYNNLRNFSKYLVFVKIFGDF